MKTKVIVLSDIHYVLNGVAGEKNRRGEFGDTLLLRAVHRINRFLKPDLVILGGDLVDTGDTEAIKAIKKITDLLTMPVLALPGNHDCSVEKFFEIYPKNPDVIDINDCRFIPFYDQEMPDYNAKRSNDDLERMKSLATDFSGPVISCQHVPLFQPGTTECPYNLTNAEETISIMKECGVSVSISGHFHSGFFSNSQPFGTSVSVPALSEKPFTFWELNIEKSGLSYCEHHLALPEELRLFDVHVHSHFAYCSENMNFQKAIELADMFNLNKLSFSEHSGHLYFSAEDYWGGKAYQEMDLDKAFKNSSRFDSYIDEVTPFKSDSCIRGLEIDCNFQGLPIIDENHLKYAELRLGAIHCLPEEAWKNKSDTINCFKQLMEKFVEFPMDIIAHPFRVFGRQNMDVPEELFGFMIKLLKDKNLAAELNFHTNEPSQKFFSMCLNEGVKLALGSDSHNLYEVGEFYPHLDFLKHIGGDGDIKVLL